MIDSVILEEETVSADFSLEILWLMHAHVRHEVCRTDDWKYPPASVSLSDKIAEAILFCEEFEETVAAIQLTHHDCLVIDACVPDDAKSVGGEAIGRTTQLIQFAARRALRDHEPEVQFSYVPKETSDADTYASAHENSDAGPALSDTTMD